MKNKNKFFLSAITATIFTIGTILMLFSNTLHIGSAMLLLGFIIGTISLNTTRKRLFSDTFLFTAIIISLVILTYTYFIEYSKNIIIISTSFYALNFLIQINKPSYRVREIKKIQTNKTKEKVSNIKKAIKEIKKEIQDNKKDIPEIKYYFTDKGKSFHKAGCIALSRSKQENLKMSTMREELIAKGYKTCKACNS
ncbi:MAG: hypothetical protein ACLFN8_05210 [Candidatus Woesearchaeota archaeon]